jgi:hypothetical protein
MFARKTLYGYQTNPQVRAMSFSALRCLAQHIYEWSSSQPQYISPKLDKYYCALLNRKARFFNT